MPKPALKSNPRIEITPTLDQYEQLCEDLAALRATGATSNTLAIVEAVHRAAAGHMLNSNQKKSRAARRRHPARQQEASPDAAQR